MSSPSFASIRCPILRLTGSSSTNNTFSRRGCDTVTGSGAASLCLGVTDCECIEDAAVDVWPAEAEPEVWEPLFPTTPLPKCNCCCSSIIVQQQLSISGSGATLWLANSRPFIGMEFRKSGQSSNSGFKSSGRGGWVIFEPAWTGIAHQNTVPLLVWTTQEQEFYERTRGAQNSRGKSVPKQAHTTVTAGKPARSFGKVTIQEITNLCDAHRRFHGSSKFEANWKAEVRAHASML
jgi:hypothetical protein